MKRKIPEEEYCQLCHRYTRIRGIEAPNNHDWYCPTLDQATLIKNTAEKVKTILDILQNHFQ